MTAGLFEAICAGVTLLFLWTTTAVGMGIWIMRLINGTKDAILADFDKKHEANSQTVKALSELVIRHDVLLNAEFGSPQKNGRSYIRS